ncbi:HAD-IA family hydrolase [Gracilibacillus caseinilyticus]|uniref:HAD-IA family hydrolase n=1 Tax=Gracilibacillus caseinilyticus TaxID=2932256 RepID=A0ABY4EX65_9BACI|nr:HAD-IA family hydrolase [Gracilibacillus caseinilyticus]UOQ46766.1 HAD-IA family hydrolase [Gracilibacillus caseinilyticus]
MKNIQLVLDVGGVLATDLDHFWSELVKQAQVPYEAVRQKYRQDIREKLWQGHIEEHEFWNWLYKTFPTIEVDSLKEALANSLYTLEGMNHLNEWSRLADLHILSNHRSEWLLSLLDPIRPILHTITISSLVGAAKPDKTIYHHCMAQLPSDKTVLFVDNKQENLEPAKAIGWHTIHAKPDQHWINQVTDFLHTYQ